MRQLYIILGLLTSLFSSIFYDGHAQSANFEWLRGIHAESSKFFPTSASGVELAVDEEGDIIVLGSFRDTVSFFNGSVFGEEIISQSPPQYDDIFLAKYAPDGEVKWFKTFTPYGLSPGGVCTDSSGAVYVAGQFKNDSLDLNPGGNGGVVSSFSSTNTDGFIVKYDVAGNFLWATTIAGPSNEWVRDIAADKNGHIYITGGMGSSANFNPGGMGGNLVSYATSAAYLAKYDGDGNYLWGVPLAASGGLNNDGFAIDVDNAGFVCVGGQFQQTAHFDSRTGSGESLINSSAHNLYIDPFLAKYDQDGNLMWAKSDMKSADSANQQLIRSISFDAEGNVFFIRQGRGGQTDSLALFKYDFGGGIVWKEVIADGNNSLSANDLSVDSSGNIYVCGSYAADDFFNFNPDGVAALLPSTSNRDFSYIVSYDSLSNFRWVKWFGRTSQSSQFCRAQAIEVDKYGNIYTTGGVQKNDSINFDPGFSNERHSFLSDGMFLVKYNLSCNSLVTKIEHACDSFSFKGTVYTANTILYDTFLASNGCDSVLILDLIMGSSTDGDTTRGSYCGAVEFNGVEYTASGVYVQQYTNVSGCDSNLIYDIVVGSEYMDTVVVQACESYTFRDSLFTSSGAYTFSYSTPSGCDSVVLLDLTVKPAPEASVAVSGSTLTASSADAYQWVDCDNNYNAVAGATARSFSPQHSGNYAVVVMVDGCSDTSECVFVESTGIYDALDTDYAKLYPNPTKGRVTVSLSMYQPNIEIRLTDVLGKTVLHDNLSLDREVFDIDIQPYSAGLYFLDITSGDQIYRFKIIKE